MPTLGQVLDVRSDLASESRQVTLGLNGVTRRGMTMQLSWTLSSARDQESGGRFGARSGFAGATTAGDPSVRDWGSSDFERRHSFLATVTRPFGPSFELTGIGRLTSGTPFTPMVAGDINGDGARNDRAFVIPAAVNLGFACLDRQIGAIAGRNSCRGPWQATFDLQANWRPTMLGLSRRLAVSIVTVNLLRGVDELLHGADDARGWGVSLRPDPVLVAVTGFDATSRTFQYALNERFGSTRGTAGFRAPFQIGIQARLTIGPDRQRAALDQLRGAAAQSPGGARQRGAVRGCAGSGAGAGAGGAGDFLARFASLLLNPAERVLALDDSLNLALDTAQVRLLERERDSLAARFAANADSTRAAIERAGQEGGPQALLQVIRPRLEEAWADVLASTEAVRGILTPDQWTRLPEGIRRPRRQGLGRN